MQSLPFEINLTQRVTEYKNTLFIFISSIFSFLFSDFIFSTDLCFYLVNNQRKKKLRRPSSKAIRRVVLRVSC